MGTSSLSGNMPALSDVMLAAARTSGIMAPTLRRRAASAASCSVGRDERSQVHFGRAVLAGALACAAAPVRACASPCSGGGTIAPQPRQPLAETADGLVPRRFVQRDAVHHAAAQARADGMDAAGSEEPAGQAVTGLPDMAAERAGESLAKPDEIEDEADKTGEGVKGCGSAGPSPRWNGLGSAIGCGGCCGAHGWTIA